MTRPVKPFTAAFCTGVVGLLLAGNVPATRGGDVTVTIDHEAVDSLGITRLRWQQPNGNRAGMTRWELTVYPHPTENLSPTVVSWEARPSFLKTPARWKVRTAPVGATPVFTKQGGRDTKASGLTAEGTYVFELTVVDRTKFATQDVIVTVAAKEPAAAAAQRFADPPEAWQKDERRIVARGMVVGTVVEKRRTSVTVKSSSGKTARYIPRWIGGAPRQGGGPEKRIVEAISRLRPGDRVSVKWYVNDHVRIEDIQPAR